jgi:hypothetical protein
MEATPRERKAFTAYYRGQQDGTGPAPSDQPDGGPRASKLHRGMSDLLAGKPAPSDQADAPSGVDPAVWAKAQASVAAGPSSPTFALASALLDLAQQLADLKGTQA